jgi:hypothetical protein
MTVLAPITFDKVAVAISDATTDKFDVATSDATVAAVCVHATQTQVKEEVKEKNKPNHNAP